MREKDQRRRFKEGAAFDANPALAASEDGPEVEFFASERTEESRDVLLSVLPRVREEHRAASVLRHVEERFYAEAAEVLGVPQGTAKRWAHTGRVTLLAAMSCSPGGNPEGNGRSTCSGCFAREGTTGRSCFVIDIERSPTNASLNPNSPAGIFPLCPASMTSPTHPLCRPGTRSSVDTMRLLTKGGIEVPRWGSPVVPGCREASPPGRSGVDWRRAPRPCSRSSPRRICGGSQA